MFDNFTITTWIKYSIVGLFAVIGLFNAGRFYETVNADEIIVIQSPYEGRLDWYTTPGLKTQMFGDITRYQKQVSQEFESKIMFNDNGTGRIIGTYQVEMPVDNEHLTELHTRFGNQEAIEKTLVKATLDKVITMTGPMMTSKEASAEKKTDLIYYITDQLEHGVYKTNKRTETKIDPITKEENTLVIAEVAIGKDGKPLRQEDPVLSRFGIIVSNFAPRDIDFDDKVKKQIEKQQEITMRVQTAIAEKLEAEQRRITAQADGQANVMKARYETEMEKAQAVVSAEKSRDVAKLDKEQAQYEKDANILRGQGEAEKKRLAMAADNALQAKIDAQVQIQQHWANAFANYTGNIAPSVIMGGSASDGKNHQVALDFINLLIASNAKALALDSNVVRSIQPKQE